MQSGSFYPPPPGHDQVPKRYNPADYRPQGQAVQYDNNEYGGQYSPARYRPAQPYYPDPYARPASAGAINRYDRSSQSGRDRDYYGSDDTGGNEQERGREGGRSRHKKKHKSQSRSLSGLRPNIKSKIDHTFDATERGLASGALGAVAGGLIGHQFGKNPLATVAGALIGGFGANAWEAKEHREKEEEHQRERESQSHRSQSEGHGHRRQHRHQDDDRRGSNEGYLGGAGGGGSEAEVRGTAVYDSHVGGNSARGPRAAGGEGDRSFGAGEGGGDGGYDSYEEDYQKRKREKVQRRKERERREERQEAEDQYKWGNVLRP